MTREEQLIAERVLLDVLIEQADTAEERSAWEQEQARRLALLNGESRQLRLFL
jgi:hypothetical protein